MRRAADHFFCLRRRNDRRGFVLTLRPLIFFPALPFTLAEEWMYDEAVCTPSGPVHELCLSKSGQSSPLADPNPPKKIKI